MTYANYDLTNLATVRDWSVLVSVVDLIWGSVLSLTVGLAGLTAADILHRAGRDVLVVDKGREVGGRMASRRIGEATFDHGAQFFTAKDPGFAEVVAQWNDSGIVAEWFRRTSTSVDGHLRWRGRPSMTAGLAFRLHLEAVWKISPTNAALRSWPFWTVLRVCRRRGGSFGDQNS